MRKIQLWSVAIVSLFSFVFILPVQAADSSFTINHGDSTTKSRYVTLWFIPNRPVQYVRVSDTADMGSAPWYGYFSQKGWVLPPGAGVKTVYVQFREKSGVLSPVVSDSINLSLPATTTLNFAINNNASDTNSRFVDLVFNYSDGVETVEIGNSPDTLEPAVRVQKNVEWILSPGTGDKTVYVKYTDGYGSTKMVTKKIKYTQPARYIKEGTLLKGQDNTIYYFGFDGRLHAFLHSGIYHSWFKDFGSVTVVSQPKIREYEIGSPLCIRPGTWLLRFTNSPRVYAVEPGCMIRPLRSESEAYILYGKNWQKKIMVMDPFYEIFYHVKNLSQYQSYDDQDRDGIDLRQEEMYGSSDKKVDSDNDGLSDYEEIVYWFSDPTLADTDGDGVKDGTEIIRNQSPVGFGDLKKVPENTYEYPLGSVVYDFEKKSTVYRDTNGSFYPYTAMKKSNSSDKKIPFNEEFIIRPTILVPIPKSKASRSSEPTFLQYPVTQSASGYIAQ